jgi:hypothetical protein
VAGQAVEECVGIVTIEDVLEELLQVGPSLAAACVLAGTGNQAFRCVFGFFGGTCSEPTQVHLLAGGDCG